LLSDLLCRLFCILSKNENILVDTGIPAASVKDNTSFAGKASFLAEKKFLKADDTGDR